MLIFNLTLMLSTLNDISWVNQSPNVNQMESDNYHSGQLRDRLLTILQRLNESQTTNMTDTQLFVHLLNHSEQARLAYDQRNNVMDQIETRVVEQTDETINIWIQVLLYVIYAVICVLGVCGNTLVCFVVARNPAMHTVTNVFIANLALSDILLCIFAVPFTPLYLLAYKSWVFGTALCHLLPFAQGVSIYISAFTLMSIAIDRYFVIMYPLKPRMKMKICVLIIAAIWLTTSILTWPYAHFMQLIELNVENSPSSNIPETGGEAIFYCDERWPYDGTRKMFGISTTILQFVIPFIIITFCYVQVCGKLWDRAKTIPGNVSARREEQERERTRKTNGMLISMVSIFVISWLPLNIHNLLMDFYEETSHWPHQQTVFLFVHATAVSSAIYNPWIYAWLNDNFRKEFKAILPCGRLKSTFFRSTIIELQQNSTRLNCPNNSSRRCAKLHYGEDAATPTDRPKSGSSVSDVKRNGEPKCEPEQMEQLIHTNNGFQDGSTMPKRVSLTVYDCNSNETDNGSTTNGNNNKCMQQDEIGSD
ncbi:hypothetical protein BLOT_013316 [Blomia tropicalis]|nr:hypothetical protein BLOT_013316 [Blomia tropicalis]